METTESMLSEEDRIEEENEEENTIKSVLIKQKNMRILHKSYRHPFLKLDSSLYKNWV